LCSLLSVGVWYQAELRDCQAILAVDELQSISCGPKTIDFGLVSVRACNKKCFSIVNNHTHAILVALKVACLPRMGLLSFTALHV
jgi:hypothetical protein